MRRSLIAAICILVTFVATACTGGGRSPTSIPDAARHPVAAPAAASARLPRGVVSIPLVHSGVRLGSGFGSVWVEARGVGELYRVDPRTNRVIATIPTKGPMCGTPTAMFRRVWVSYCQLPGAAVVDPRSNRLVGKVAARTLDFAGLRHRIWMPDAFDPRTLQLVRRVHVGAPDGFTGGVVAALHRLWGFDVKNLGDFVRIDPRSGRVTGRFVVGERETSGNLAAVYRGRIWVYGARARVWVVDPRTVRVTVHVLPGLDQNNRFGTFTVARGDLWVRQAQAVHRYALPTLRPVATYPAGPGLGGFVIIAFGSLWITNVEDGSLWRVRI